MLARSPEKSLQQAIEAEVALLGPAVEGEADDDSDGSDSSDEGEDDDEDMAKPSIENM